MVTVTSRRRFAHIDALRAFAVLIVVISHSTIGKLVPGGSGVTIFFGISGFIITYLLLKERDRSGSFAIGQFYLRRLIKIAPPFVVAILIPSLILAAMYPIDWAALASQVFFAFNWTAIVGHGRVLPGSGVVWSLAIEEQFYIAVSLVWLVLVRWRYWRAVLLFMGVTGIIAPVVIRFNLLGIPNSETRIYFGTDSRLDGIAWGLVLALAYHAWSEHGEPQLAIIKFLASDWVLAGAITGYVGSLLLRDPWFRDTIRFSIQSMSAILILSYGLLDSPSTIRKFFVRVCENRLTAAVGLASYSIYIVHDVVIQAVTRLLPDSMIASPVIAIGLALVAGSLLYIAVEVPSRKLRGKLKRSAIA